MKSNSRTRCYIYILVSLYLFLCLLLNIIQIVIAKKGKEDPSIWLDHTVMLQNLHKDWPHDADYKGNRDYIYNQIPPRHIGHDVYDKSNVYCPFSWNYDPASGDGNPCHQLPKTIGPPLIVYLKLKKYDKKYEKKMMKHEKKNNDHW